VAAVVLAGTRAGRPVVAPRDLSRADAIALGIVTLAGLGLNVAMFFAFDLTTVAIVLLAFYTYPALVAVTSVALGHEQLDRIGWAALALALIGVALVVAGGLSGGVVTISPLGVGLGLVAAACQTVFVTVSRGRFRAVPAEQATGVVLLGTAAACVVGSVVAGADLGAALATPQALRLVGLTGVVAAGIPSVLFLNGIRVIGGTRAGILMLIEPLVGVTLAAVLLHEGLQPIQVVGGAGILIGALLLQGSGRPAETIEPAARPVEGVVDSFVEGARGA
jgi:drug/metabolite transporter, DME family